MRVVEVSSLDFAIVARLLAVFFSFVVLLALFEKSMRRVVMRQVLGPVEIILGIAIHRAIARMQLLQNPAASFGPVLPFGVILRPFLNSVAVLHSDSPS